MVLERRGDSISLWFEVFGNLVGERIPEFVANWGTISSVERWVSGLYIASWNLVLVWVRIVMLVHPMV